MVQAATTSFFDYEISECKQCYLSGNHMNHQLDYGAKPVVVQFVSSFPHPYAMIASSLCPPLMALPAMIIPLALLVTVVIAQTTSPTLATDQCPPCGSAINCLPYDTRYQAADIDEAMNNFPDLTVTSATSVSDSPTTTSSTVRSRCLSI